MEHQADGMNTADIATESMNKMSISEEEQSPIDNKKHVGEGGEGEPVEQPKPDEIMCNDIEDSQDVASRCSNEEKGSSSGRRSPSETVTDTKSNASSQAPEYIEGPPSSSGETYSNMYNPDTATNSNEILQDIPGLPAEKLMECRHDIISSTSINPYSHQHYGPGNDSPCYFLSSSQQIFTVVESVVHFLTQPVVNFIRGEWIVSFMPFPVAQHVCISLDDGMKRYEEVLRVQPSVDNPTKVDLITVEHRLMSGNTMHRPRFKEALRQSLTEIGKQLSGEAPWEIFVSRASGRALAMDAMIHSFLSESHEPLETHCSPMVEHANTPIFAKLTAAPYIIVGSIYRPVLRYASWLLVSSHYQLHETITLNLNYKTRRIEATSLDSALGKSSYTEELGPALVLLDAVSYVNDSVTGNAVLSNNTILGRNLHPFLNFDNNPIFNRGLNPCFTSTFAPPSNTSNPVSSVGLIITPPGHPPHMGGHQNPPPHNQHGPGNFPMANAYPAPLFSYSPYGLLQQVVPPIPIVPENFYPAPPYGHYIERPDLMLNPNAQDFFPDAEDKMMAGNHPNNFAEQGMDGVSQPSNSETSLQKQHCQNAGSYMHHAPANYDSELTLVMIRARESQSDLANNVSASRTHSKSWSEETEGGEHELHEDYTYVNANVATYQESPLIVEAAYKNVTEWKSSNQVHAYAGDHNGGGNNWQRYGYGNQKYHVKGGQGDKYPDGSENYHQGVEYTSADENSGNYNERYPRRRDHYNKNYNKNYYGGQNNKPRYNNSNSSNASNDRYNSGNSYSRGNDTSQSQTSQSGSYSPNERGRGNYGRNRGRGRSYQQRSNNSSNT